MTHMALISYGLCLVASIICLVLLLRAYSRNRSNLLLWSSVCFFFFAVQNVMLLVDVSFPLQNYGVWRAAAGFLGPAIWLCALIWEKRR